MPPFAFGLIAPPPLTFGHILVSMWFSDVEWGERYQATSDVGGGGGGGITINQLVSIVAKHIILYTTINETIFLKIEVLCAIFLKLRKYSYFHYHSINMNIYKYISWSYEYVKSSS